MNRTNCPNCGAALPQFGGKCEFCGTRVVDLTMLDFDAREPTMFLLRLPKNISDQYGNNLTISMWANPELNSFIVENNYSSCYGGWGNKKLLRIPSEPEVAFEMTLRPCADPRDNSMFHLNIDKEIKL